MPDDLKIPLLEAEEDTSIPGKDEWIESITTVGNACGYTVNEGGVTQIKKVFRPPFGWCVQVVFNIYAGTIGDRDGYLERSEYIPIRHVEEITVVRDVHRYFHRHPDGTIEEPCHA